MKDDPLLVPDKLVTLVFHEVTKKLKLSPNERLELQYFDGGHVLLAAPGELDGWRIGLVYFRVKRDGDVVRESYRSSRTSVDFRPMMRFSKGHVVDAVISAIQYLVAVVLPVKKPKGYRLLDRGLIKVSRPKHGWRKFSRAA